MAFITSPQVLRIQNAVGSNIIASARTLQFIGGIVVTDAGDGKAVIDGTGASGSPWDVLGNAGSGLKLGTNTADSWDMIVNAVRAAGFDADGLFDVFGKNILSLSVDPSAGAGVAATIGSIGMRNSGGTGQLWLKAGAADTAWANISTATSAWLTSGNTLTGGSPTTPDQAFGSANDYDVILGRNSLPVMRLIQDGAVGVLIGGSTHIGTGAARLELQQTVNAALIQRDCLTLAGRVATNLRRLGRADTSGATSVDVDFGVQTGVNQLVEVSVSARQIAGGTGAIGDGAGFKIMVTLKNNLGVVTILNQSSAYSYAIDPGITVTVSANAGSMRVTCTGVAGRDLSWSISANALLSS